MERTAGYCARGHFWLLYAAIYNGHKVCLECNRLNVRKNRLERRLANFFQREQDEQDLRSRRL